ncbi:PREDICTED: receptor-type tyrosine-protein phosphatase T-like [Amphimedon queenslandica]|uniref:Fibronectin type-III domain-containing protein n=2 Tax=Amphimedon queenslandica TaxID=400682 RepID=A0AAN0JNT0_AMPQE|nr:PREDICTED: receptor-type tyrosine-protein phosphatase T-like [Amphimedon queenslandica]|eukprot:XP_019858695.1 PREDICTED: receptor-type tyrosine-protein phosphatase T-like [Amphimedon queenslandica]
MNYTITVRAWNVLGASNYTSVKKHAIFLKAPTGVPTSLSLLQPINNLTWNEVNCSERNGLITGYTVMISNSGVTYNLTSTERYIILNDLVFGTEYNISVAAVNSAGRGPFSDPTIVEIGMVPGPVGSASSIMDTTWAIISWSVPSYIPSDYPIITYEIGYHALESGNCSMVYDDDINPQVLNLFNVSSNDTFTTITGLNSNTCYIFGIRPYSDNGYGEWTVTTNETLELLTESSSILMSPSSAQILLFTIASSSTTKQFLSTVISPSSTVKSLSSSVIQTSVAATMKPENTSFIVTVGGSGIAVIMIALLIVLIVIIIAFIKRKKSLKISKYNVNIAMSEIQDNESLTKNDEDKYCEINKEESNYAAIQEAPIPSVYEPTYTDIETALLSGCNFDPQIPLTLPISLEDLNTHVTSCHSNGFESQYTSLKSGEEKPCTVGYSEENSPFNRFKNITVYDDNRIILATNPNLDMCQREYINASYVDVSLIFY